MFTLHILPLSLHTLSEGQKSMLSIDADQGNHELCSVQTQEAILEELLLSKKEHKWTCKISVKSLFCKYYHFSLIILSLKYGMGQCGACMWAGQQVLGLLQDLFKRSKLSLTLALTWSNCKGSCSDHNWDSWAPCIALCPSQNIVQRLKHVETIQAIEHSAVVNGCKKSGNSYYWSEVTTVFIRSTKSPYILYGTPSKFYPSPCVWCHHESRPLMGAETKC